MLPFFCCPILGFGANISCLLYMALVRRAWGWQYLRRDLVSDEGEAVGYKSRCLWGGWDTCPSGALLSLEDPCLQSRSQSVWFGVFLWMPGWQVPGNHLETHNGRFVTACALHDFFNRHLLLLQAQDPGFSRTQSWVGLMVIAWFSVEAATARVKEINHCNEGSFKNSPNSSNACTPSLPEPWHGRVAICHQGLLIAPLEIVTRFQLFGVIGSSYFVAYCTTIILVNLLFLWGTFIPIS